MVKTLYLSVKNILSLWGIHYLSVPEKGKKAKFNKIKISRSLF